MYFIQLWLMYLNIRACNFNVQILVFLHCSVHMSSRLFFLSRDEDNDTDTWYHKETKSHGNFWTSLKTCRTTNVSVSSFVNICPFETSRFEFEGKQKIKAFVNQQLPVQSTTFFYFEAYLSILRLKEGRGEDKWETAAPCTLLEYFSKLLLPPFMTHVGGKWIGLETTAQSSL